jgi:dTDP-4-amino-4,6-dideoxygalactose transaminase
VIPINDLTRGIAQSEEAAEAITRVLRSGYWIHGPEHAAFEEEFAEFLRIDHVLGVASGTDALEIALRALGCKRGSKIITVANAGGYTPIAAASIGCEVIYCDIDPERLLMDPKALTPLLSKKISAVVVTHLYGNVAPVSEIKVMCQQFGIPVIEDCAQAIGGHEGAFRLGTIGDIGAFSFYPTKNLGGIGDGGALATKNPELAKRVSQLRQYGWGAKYDIQISGGMNSRLDEIQAAVLRIGLKQVDELNSRRKSIATVYFNALKNSRINLVTSTLQNSVAHLAVLLLPSREKREHFRDSLRLAGIQTDVHYPIFDFDQYGLIGGKQNLCLPNTVSLGGRIVSIPLFPELKESEVTKIANVLRDYQS